MSCVTKSLKKSVTPNTAHSTCSRSTIYTHTHTYTHTHMHTHTHAHAHTHTHTNYITLKIIKKFIISMTLRTYMHTYIHTYINRCTVQYSHASKSRHITHHMRHQLQARASTIKVIALESKLHTLAVQASQPTAFALVSVYCQPQFVVNSNLTGAHDHLPSHNRGSFDTLLGERGLNKLLD